MNDNLELQAWLDGELPAPQARRIEQEIAADEEARRMVAELQAVKGALAGNEEARAVPETREFYWSKIERQIQGQPQEARPAQAARERGWLRWVSPLAGCAGLACLLLLAVIPSGPPAFDETSTAGEGLEAITFHDQIAGMTVVWLADTAQAGPAASPAGTTPEGAESEIEVE
jgi:anti-sigma factor RsiW